MLQNDLKTIREILKKRLDFYTEELTLLTNSISTNCIKDQFIYKRNINCIKEVIVALDEEKNHKILKLKL